MTANQLQYQRNAEERRHNEAMERFNTASLAISDKQANASLTQAGAAAQQAQVAAYRAAEESRHNRAAEAETEAKMWADFGSSIYGSTARVVQSFM